LFDEEVQIQSKIRSGSVTQGPEYEETPRKVRAKIEVGGALEGSFDSSLGSGRVFLLTNDPPKLGDLITLPYPYPRHPTINEVAPMKFNGKIHHVVVYFA